MSLGPKALNYDSSYLYNLSRLVEEYLNEDNAEFSEDDHEFPEVSVP